MAARPRALSRRGGHEIREAPLSSDFTHPIRVLLVDDHRAVRDALALLLAAEDIVIMAEATGRAQLPAALEKGAPDLALVDVSLGGGNGLTVVAEMTARDVPVLVYSVYSDAARITRALAAGARGYVTKREAHRVLIDAIREVAAGREYLGPQAAAALHAEGEPDR